ncbi:MAG TPA: hypothetical protein VK527_10440 [Candidatus Limnocylindrales bacterium]|nr:hypothetical protein [Candidatus Limnocylindrales bacterium]
MKKMLAVTLVLVFTCALLFALGCSKKTEQTGTEGEQGMEQTTTPPASMDTTMMADTTHMH